MLSRPPFRDDLAAALGRAERLERDNALLRARLAGRRFDCVQWILVSVIALSALAIGCILAAGRLRPNRRESPGGSVK
jgi:hypothetical protein